MNPKFLFQLANTALKNWMNDYAPSMGAALAYYTVFSIAPLLIIVIAVAALIFGQDAAQAAIMDQARGMIGENGAKAIEGMLASAQKPKQGMIASSLGVLLLFIGATSVLAELESNLNRIWKVEPDKRSGIWHFIRTRLLSIGMVLAIGFLLIVSLVVSAAIAAWGKYWGDWFGGMETLLHVTNFVVSVGIVTVLFAIIYKFMPQVAIRWRDVWIGALVTSLLFSFGKFLIGLYIGKSGVESSYGAAGALAVLLVWVYYSAQIFLLGAEFTKVYAESHGSRKNEKPRTVASTGTPKLA
ncbi:MAG TPA: YihY/virulence factor BrkB family protein [Burkholderiales bacterium]|nr:YihY/virulence factor BrkB family protein [Burkholderiales bacterium]